MQRPDKNSTPSGKFSSGSARGDFADDLDAAAQKLEEALKNDDLGIFYRAFRQTRLPFLPLELRATPDTLFRQVTEVIQRLSHLSPAVALAVENHFSVLCPIATLPTAHDEQIDARRLKLLEEVGAKRWLVANTSSRIHDDQIAKSGTVAKRSGEQFEISGKAAYLSLASEGDLIVFITFFETGQPALFACPLQSNPAIEIGPLLFPRVMRDSDTRRVTFHDLKLDPSHLLVSGLEHPQILPIMTYQIAWHQSLLAALAVGTAERALEEGRVFLRSVKRPDGVPLAELDGMVVDMGRQVLGYRVARCCVEQAGLALARLASQPFESEALSEAFELACSAKYHCTGYAEDVVGVVRRIVGARSFTGGHGIERLSEEVVFGPLGGEVNAIIERRVGKRALGEASLDSSRNRTPDEEH